MRAGAEAVWGSPTLAGRRVGVAGVGKVGHHLVEHLLRDGAGVVACDVDREALGRLTSAHPDVEVLEPDALPSAAIDVYAPCAMGAALDDETVPALQASLVCGAANNQLAHEGIEKQLADRGVLYCPDYVVNAGGLIQVADEIEGYVAERATARALGILGITRQVLATAAAEHVPPATAADRVAERRMTDVGRLRSILIP